MTRSNFIASIFLVSAIALGFASFWYYRETIFSKEILTLKILSQSSAEIGDEIEYVVEYKNNGNFILENPKIIFELPENSLTEDEKVRFVQDLDDVHPNSGDILKFKGRLLGKEGDIKIAKASLSYVPRNLSARYESETTFNTEISVVPIIFKVNLPQETEGGKEMTYSVDYLSNIDYPLENLAIKVDDSDKFTFKSSNPNSLDGSEWKINVLNKDQGGSIIIKGDVSIEAGELNLLAKIGLWRNGSFVVIKETKANTRIIKPTVEVLSESVNNQTGSMEVINQ
jgi:uncharacterized repeat protein (TIGR01451 family)